MSKIATISMYDFRQQILQQDALIIDIRDADSYKQQHIDAAVNVKPNDVATYLSLNQQPEQKVFIYCYRGRSSMTVTEQLTQQGFSNVFSVDGGFEAWANQ